MNNFLRVLIICFFLSAPAFAYLEDTAAKYLIDKNVEKPVVNSKYNYQSTVSVPIKLSPIEKIKSDKDLCEGQIVKFKVAENVVYGRKTLARKGDTVTARVETIITNGMNGIPASVIFGDFKINGLAQSKLSQKYERFGADLSLLVFPLKWALTPLPPTGSLTNFIKGGRVKMSKKSVITICYYPEW